MFQTYDYPDWGVCSCFRRTTIQTGACVHVSGLRLSRLVRVFMFQAYDYPDWGVCSCFDLRLSRLGRVFMFRPTTIQTVTCVHVLTYDYPDCGVCSCFRPTTIQTVTCVPVSDLRLSGHEPVCPSHAGRLVVQLLCLHTAQRTLLRPQSLHPQRRFLRRHLLEGLGRLQLLPQVRLYGRVQQVGQEEKFGLRTVCVLYEVSMDPFHFFVF